MFFKRNRKARFIINMTTTRYGRVLPMSMTAEELADRVRESGGTAHRQPVVKTGRNDVEGRN